MFPLTIVDLNTHEMMVYDILRSETYEGAVEKAIKYVLENLI